MAQRIGGHRIFPRGAGGAAAGALHGRPRGVRRLPGGGGWKGETRDTGVGPSRCVTIKNFASGDNPTGIPAVPPPRIRIRDASGHLAGGVVPEGGHLGPEVLLRAPGPGPLGPRLLEVRRQRRHLPPLRPLRALGGSTGHGTMALTPTPTQTVEAAFFSFQNGLQNPVSGHPPLSNTRQSARKHMRWGEGGSGGHGTRDGPHLGALRRRRWGAFGRPLHV